MLRTNRDLRTNDRTSGVDHFSQGCSSAGGELSIVHCALTPDYDAPRR